MAAGFYAFVVRNVSIQRGNIQGDKEGLMLRGGGGGVLLVLTELYVTT